VAGQGTLLEVKLNQREELMELNDTGVFQVQQTLQHLKTVIDEAYNTREAERLRELVASAENDLAQIRSDLHNWFGRAFMDEIKDKEAHERQDAYEAKIR
jgi:hypothetical protein